MQLTINDVLGIIQTTKNTYPYSFKNLDVDNNEELKKELNNTANLWFALLEEYPKEIVIKAFHEALKVEKVNIVPASIITQIEKIKTSFEPSKDELWQQLIDILPKAREYKNRPYDIAYIREKIKRYDKNLDKDIDDTVLSEKKVEYGIKKLPELFESLNSVLKGFLVNAQSLGELALLDKDDLKFEKVRFFKNFDSYKERIKFRTCPQLVELTKNIGIKPKFKHRQELDKPLTHCKGRE